MWLYNLSNKANLNTDWKLKVSSLKYPLFEYHFIMLLSTSPSLCGVYMRRGGRGRGKWDFCITFTLSYPFHLPVYAFLDMEGWAIWFLDLSLCCIERKGSHIRKYLLLILIILIYILYLYGNFIRYEYLSKAGCIQGSLLTF